MSVCITSLLKYVRAAEIDNEEGGTIRPYKCMGKVCCRNVWDYCMHNVRSEKNYAADLNEVSAERTGV